jgi:adenine-specific DNA-methyltransferase
MSKANNTPKNKTKNSSHDIDIAKMINKFPTTRYQGSKRKIIPWIYDCIKDIEFQTVLDAFGGSGVVSYLFKVMKKNVTFNDILKFNQIIGDSIIANNNVILNDTDITLILDKDIKHKTFITNKFQGIFYRKNENMWLDKIIFNIENLSKVYSGTELRYKKAIAYNALFQSCLTKRPYNLFHRKNLNMRTRNVQRNFGNKVTWDTPFPKQFRKFVNEINKSIFDSEMQCISINHSVFSLKKNNYDLVYFDSPYIKAGIRNESSDYLRCYHFLEGISKYNIWKNLIDEDSINKRIKDEIIPNYFVPQRAMSTFDRLFSKFKDSIIVVSYKYGGIPSIEELSKLLKKYKHNIRTFDKHYKYALNKQNGDAVLNREYILIGE